MKLIAILSTRYAGSTLLDFMLGAHPNALSLTELRSFIITKRRPFRCQRCGEDCAVWTPVLKERLLQIGAHADLYRAIADSTHASVLIDSSKIIKGWFTRTLADLNPADVVCVHLSKAPEGYAGSERGKQMTSGHQDLSAIAENWWRANGQILDFLAESPFKTVSLRYRDLVTHTPVVLNYLLELVDLTYQPGQEHFWNFDQHPLWGNKGTRSHLHEGNPDFVDKWVDESDLNKKLYKQKHQQIYFDDKWRQLLSAAEVDWLYAHPRVAPIARLLGYSHPLHGSALAVADEVWTPATVIGSEAAHAERHARRRDLWSHHWVQRVRRKLGKL